ncbi:MAG: antitoxin family protein [Anaerolineae bacterium]|nr:antitoxin family protein [Anaerolineae bacterium]
MERTVTVVYENGVFRPLEPVNLTEGQIIHMPLPEQTTGQLSERNRRLMALADEWLAHPDPALEAEESFEEFYAFLQENRMTFEERDLGMTDE